MGATAAAAGTAPTGAGSRGPRSPGTSNRTRAPASNISTATRYGFGDAADRIQDLYLAGRKQEAIGAVPDEMVRGVSLVGPRGFVKERLAAYAEAGVTTMLVHPFGADERESVRFVEELLSLTR